MFRVFILHFILYRAAEDFVYLENPLFIKTKTFEKRQNLTPKFSNSGILLIKKILCSVIATLSLTNNRIPFFLDNFVASYDPHRQQFFLGLPYLLKNKS